MISFSKKRMENDMFKKTLKGYSTEVAEKYLPTGKAMLVGMHPVVQYLYKEGKRTDEIQGYQVWFAIEDENPFKIKFIQKPDLSKFELGDIVELQNLEAIEIRDNVYFRASSMKKV